ncbi:MAG: hypothetical protein ACXWV5_07895 [Flavitalea sp.]
MKSLSIYSFLFLFLVGFSSCEIVGDIFQAGMWTSVILIVLVVALLIWIISRFRRK